MPVDVLAAIADLGTHQLTHGAVRHHGVLDRHALQDAGLGIVGKNGDGKSTLLHLFKGTQEPDSGRVTRRLFRLIDNG